MKKIYYFSNKTLNFVEIKEFNKKFYTLVVAISLTISLVLFGGYFVVKHFSANSNSQLTVKEENKLLKKKLKDFANSYYKLNSEFEELVEKNKDLRIASNLPEISDEERRLGTGGGDIFSLFNIKKLKTGKNIDINELSNFIDNIENKIEFEKTNYEEVSKQLKYNEKLFAAIPALKPAAGTISVEGFGKRRHPILKRYRMHEGIDIVANKGTQVISPGDGKVSFVGYRGGYGLCVEINHGFGYKTIYGHLSKAKVKNTQKVKRGDVIALTGNSGLSTGPHLHYEVVHNGVKKDPMNFLFDDLRFFD